jgi:Ca-activated chloride channel family protein
MHHYLRSFQRPIWIMRLFGVVCLGAAAGHVSTSVAYAKSAPIIVVIDGSGSMWGTIPGSGTSKLALMRRQLSEQMKELLPRSEIGLTSFGAQSNRSCGAARTLLAPSPAPFAAFDEILEKFNPQGRGPIVLGLQTAVESLGASSTAARILLIHDGRDNCGQDVCAFAAGLAKNRPLVRVDVLSLALKPRDRGTMNCLAKATGGLLVETYNESESTTGLRRIILAMQQTQTAPAPSRATSPVAAKPRKTTPVPRKTSGLGLFARLAKSQKAIVDGVTWRIETISSDQPSSMRTFKTPTVDTELPPGRYRVVMSTPTAKIEKTIDVRAGRGQNVEFIFDGGLVTADLALDARAIAPIGETIISIARARDNGTPDTPIWSGPANKARALPLAVGTYKITAGNGLSRQSVTVKVALGLIQRAVFRERLAKLIVTAVGLRPDQVGANQIIVTADDPKAANGRKVVARSSATRAVFALPPGPYQISLSVFDASTRQLVVLTPGQAVTQALHLTQMALQVTSQLGFNKAPTKAGFHYRLWRSDALDRPIATSRAARPVFNLSPGKYRIESRIGLQNAVIIREFDVGAAAQGKLGLRHEAGQVSFALPANARPLGQNAYWEVLGPRGRLVWQTFASLPTLTLSTGDYTVTVETRRHRYSAKFAVVAGQSQAVMLDKK